MTSLDEPHATAIVSNTSVADLLGSRDEIADGLSRLLADTYTLYLKTQNYHWNQDVVVRTAKAVSAVVESAHDEPTADLLTQRILAHEKAAWMLRSLLVS